MTPLFCRREQLVFAGNVARMLCQSVRAENLTSDRTNEPAIGLIGATKQSQKPVRRFYGGNYGCHGLKLPAFAVFRPRDKESSSRVRVQPPCGVRQAAFGCRCALTQVNHFARTEQLSCLDCNRTYVVDTELKCRGYMSRRKKTLHCTAE